MSADYDGAVRCKRCGIVPHWLPTGDPIPQGPEDWTCPNCDGRRAVHVVPHPVDGWSVLLAGASRAYRVFESRFEAIEFGRPWAKRRRTNFVVHHETGRIAWAERWE